jgi:hypothetical protein
MIMKVVTKNILSTFDEIKENLSFWKTKTASERISAVEFLRRQQHGNTNRLEKLFEYFNAHNVQYLIVGSYALAFHGSPRYTGDIDVFVKPDKENAARIIKALADFGFASLDLETSDFESPDKVVQLGVSPVRIDLMTLISGVDWETSYEGSDDGYYGDVPVKYIGREEFIANKRASGRKKDLADLEALDAVIE